MAATGEQSPDRIRRTGQLATTLYSAAHERHIAPEHSGYPMTVGTPERRWSCMGCFTPFEAGVAIACTVHNGSGDLPHPLPYCFECVANVYEAVKAARGADT